MGFGKSLVSLVSIWFVIHSFCYGNFFTIRNHFNQYNGCRHLNYVMVTELKTRSYFSFLLFCLKLFLSITVLHSGNTSFTERENNRIRIVARTSENNRKKHVTFGIWRRVMWNIEDTVFLVHAVFLSFKIH